MIRRTSQLAKRFTHNHNNIKPNVFLPKNDYKIDYEKIQVFLKKHIIIGHCRK